MKLSHKFGIGALEVSIGLAFLLIASGLFADEEITTRHGLCSTLMTLPGLFQNTAISLKLI